MDLRTSIFLTVAAIFVIAGVTCIIYRLRQRRLEKEFYSISGMMTLTGDLADRLTWIQSQPLSVQKRLNTLYVLGGFLSCRMGSLKNAMSTYSMDRTMSQLQATLDEVDNDSYEPNELTLKSQETLRISALFVQESAQALLHHLAIEATIKRYELPTDNEIRRQFRLEMECLSSLMYQGLLLAQEADKLLREPLIEDSNTNPPKEGSK